MALGGKITLNIGTLISEEQFSGEKCVSCEECIYGTGFRVVVATSTERDLLPSFKESNIILCQSCKDALE
jgi:hypothetical protein